MIQPNYFGYPQYGQPQASMSIDRVSNLEEAKKYQIYPGSTIYLLDQDEPYIYLKTSDSQGKTSIRAFSLIEVDVNKIVDSKYITRDDFDSFKQDMYSMMNELKENNNYVKSTIKQPTEAK